MKIFLLIIGIITYIPLGVYHFIYKIGAYILASPLLLLTGLLDKKTTISEQYSNFGVATSLDLKVEQKEKRKLTSK